ncbi:MAG: DUF72 domain-containing protein [Flavobacteriales bacterium]|nr:DUF72 domain-containing protein [Flavobacteriales bacterium]
MKFGKVDNPGEINFTLPKDHPDTLKVFQKETPISHPKIFIGCAKWNKNDLKNFYPKGTKDELTYYSRQFNSIELNSSFYRIFSPEQFQKWRDKTPEGFRFFPKINQSISHYKQLNDVEEVLDQFLLSVSHLDDRLGTIFLQLHDRFAPNRFGLLEKFISIWPKDLPLTVELRHTDWFNDPAVANDLYQLLESNGISNTLVDTAGRRDIMHMRMTTPTPFIRYVGANHESDYRRIDDWVQRIEEWIGQGMQELYFFVHQNLEVESPLLSAYLIKQLNAKLGYNLNVPNGSSNAEENQLGLF